ncbi:MAG: divergent polysaccharide deacetylase family protein [Candidatus Aminicenantales bacterium]
MLRNSPKAFKPVLLFLAISLFSFLSLDYLDWRQSQGRSVVFSSVIKKKRPGPAPNFYQEILTLIRPKLSPAAKIIEADVATGKIWLETSAEEYQRLAEELKKDLAALGLMAEIQTQEEVEKGSLIRWLLKSETTDVASLFFLVSLPLEARPQLLSEKTRPAAEKKVRREGKVAIIIDDLGYDLDSINVIISLNKPITVSILPDATFAQQTAKVAESHGLEVMLHLPMESINSQGNNGSGFEITSRMTQQEIFNILQECLRLLPNIKGVNNHMGSLITQDRETMKLILSELKARSLFFIDSRTSNKSIAFKLANEMGLTAGRRDIFLDSDPGPSSLQKQLQELIKLCQRKGKLIAIGHPYPETLSFLPKALQEIEKADLKVVPVSEILKNH